VIRRLFMFVAVIACCFGTMAEAADLPMTVENPVPHRAKAKAPVKAKIAAAKLKKSATKQPRAAVASTDDQTAASSVVETAPKAGEINMAWILDPLVANADGKKKEASASVESVLVVVEPGYVPSPYVAIELNGHIIKTAKTTVRIDLQIGDIRRTVSWKDDDVQAGKFKIKLNETLPDGKMPSSFPVSAFAIVTKDGNDGAAMVSLEKVIVRLGKLRTADVQ
jgi:hypothetical protein